MELTKKETSNKWVAILTGDIVNSSVLDLSEREELQRSFSTLSGVLKKVFKRNVPYSIKNFRGDSWQLVLLDPREALACSILIRSFFRFKFNTVIDSRIAIGFGPISFIPNRNSAAGDGPAFSISGHLLDSLKKNQLAIGFYKSPANESEFKAYALLLDQIISSWSTSQSQAVYWSLQGLKQKEIAEHWLPEPISQAAVSKALKAAMWATVEESYELINTSINKITLNAIMAV